MQGLEDPFNFYLDPDPDPGSALEKNNPYPGHENFFQIFWFSDLQEIFKLVFFFLRYLFMNNSEIRI